MAKKKFKAESERLLDLMINSIYTNKDIFLRELISNASDATDKRYYSALTGGEAPLRNDLPITIEIDREKRLISISDNGCGMTLEDLENNLGIIAKSGSLEFKQSMGENPDVDIIGQFGVGFYSSFMVSDNVEVITKSLSDGQSNVWSADDASGYSIKKGDRKEVGTTVNLTIKENTEDENYDKFLDKDYIISLIKKHSDYIRYPIQMWTEHFRQKDITKNDATEDLKEKQEDGENQSNPNDSGEPTTETETYIELETINSTVPIWKRRRTDVTEAEYSDFYQSKFSDYMAPLKTIFTSAEGAVSYNSLMFIPSHLPFNYQTKEFKKGLQLYASGVMIMEHCEDLLPDYFGFVRGIVDSPDLSLNISREILQQDKQLTFIAEHIKKKIKTELAKMLADEREKYEEFFGNFGLSLKFGVYENYGINKDLLQDLLLFKSSKAGMVTLGEYVENMPEDQKYIYYASGENQTQLENLPAGEAVTAKGYELLYFTDQVDEFAIRIIGSYKDKEFRSIAGGDLGLDSSNDKENLDKKSKESKDLLEYISKKLDGKVSEATLSSRLVGHPACISTKGEITLEMERTLAAMPGGENIRAQRIFELNPDHPVFAVLERSLIDDQNLLDKYISILYNQSLLIEGLPIENPAAFIKEIDSLIV